MSDSLIEYPCRFPIKVMGESGPHFLPALIAVAREFEPAFDEQYIEIRSSKTGRYTGFTLSIWVESRAQLDALYRALSGHPMVKVVL